MISTLRTFNNLTHGGGWRRGSLFLLFLVVIGPVGHAVAACVVAINVFFFFADFGKPKPEDFIAADSPEACAARAARDARYKTQARQRPPRPREPFLSREDYEAKVREAMATEPSWDFDATCVEEPRLLPQHA